jgi:dTDP-glucose 4,6-dehydratase
MKRVLITGAAGFIGSNFTHYLSERYPEYSITALDKLTPFSSLGSIQQLIDTGRITFVKVDLASRVQVEALFGHSGFDFVINFAAESHNDRAIADSRPFIDSNVLGAYNLVEAARLHGVTRLVHVSTIEVYGEQAEGVEFFTEASPLNAKTPYSASKAAADIIIRSHMLTYPELDVAITHCANNYGAYQFPEKLIPLAIINVLRNRKIPLYGDGQQKRDWLHVLDHCRGLDLVLHRSERGLKPGAESDASKLPIWDFSARRELTNRVIIELVTDALGVRFEEHVEFVADRPNHDRRYLINPLKAERELGFTPTINLEQGIAETVAWYVDNRAWWQEILARSGELQFDWRSARAPRNTPEAA